MKTRNSKSGHYESGPNMIPLVDIVMVILIFLMLTGTFGAASHFMPWTMSSSGGPARKPRPEALASRLDVFVSSASSDTFRARLSDGAVFTDADSLRQALDVKRKAHQANGTASEKLELMINPRLSTRYSHLAAVYEAAMGAGWEKIGFRPARE
jgi:biopolymer transport protein ExbD